MTYGKGKDELSTISELRVLPEFYPVVTMIRDLMKECAPQAKEIISYGLPAYQTQRIVAVISSNKKDITFSFSARVQFALSLRLAPGGRQILPACKNQESGRCEPGRPALLHPAGVGARRQMRLRTHWCRMGIGLLTVFGLAACRSQSTATVADHLLSRLAANLQR